jgi:hypothetical protein
MYLNRKRKEIEGTKKKEIEGIAYVFEQKEKGNRGNKKKK